MLQSLSDASQSNFRTCDEVRPLIKQACETNQDVAEYFNPGVSEEGRPIDAVILGNGVRRISLIAGAHSDEPVGPETLWAFILNGIRQKEKLNALFEEFKFIVIPHINPDGETKNQTWIKEWPNFEAWLKYVFREPPGRDMEFGFSNMRKENAIVSKFLRVQGPPVMHASLHGMGFSEGAMLLIERHWIDNTKNLRAQFVDAIQRSGLRLHDHDRKGEKGFIYIAPGFTTTPEGEAMRRHFKALDDKETARLFHDSSMEFVRTLGKNPLCLVTELPLFIIEKEVNNRLAGVPAAYLEFKDKIPDLRAQIMQNQSIDNIITEFQIRPLPISTAIKLQLYAIQLGLESLKM